MKNHGILINPISNGSEKEVFDNWWLQPPSTMIFTESLGFLGAQQIGWTDNAPSASTTRCA
jgi:hypothetical protein